ncbi:MAG: ferrochelatase [Planctomycetota bacterium]|jgi:ferrochelatase
MDPSSKPSPPAGVVTCCNGHGHAGNGHAGNGRTAANGCRGVLLLNLGTPDEPDVPSVRRYLSEFLADPEVIRLPRGCRWFNKPLARLIAHFRGPASAEAYESIWTERGSPLKIITEDQVEALQSTLPKGWRVFYAMRYGQPSVASVLDAIVREGIRDLVVVPMYPQYAGPTTGTAMAQVYDHLRNGGRELSVTVRGTWYDDVGYVDAQARLIHRCAERLELDPDRCVLVYSAHSMPESYIRDGDPYQEHLLRTVELVNRRLGWPEDRMKVAYQSKLGPVPWLSPSTEQVVRELAEAGEEHVLVCPVSFTADCLETLEELGIQYRQLFEENGGGRMHLCPSLNTFEPFVKSLSQLVLRGSRPVRDGQKAPAPLVKPRVADTAAAPDAKSLVMVGVSLPPRFGDGRGPALQHVDVDEFRGVKKPHEEVTGLLREARRSGDFSECWLWNTCSRFELYGWLEAEPGSPRALEAVDRAVDRLLGDDHNGTPVNVLHGRDAWHHLLRNTAGLNSGLPGDAEVLRQLEAGGRMAMRCDAAGARTVHLIDEVVRWDDELRDETGWGRFRPEYCLVALKRVALDLRLDWRAARYVILGNSVTSRSSLKTLIEHFGVDPRRVTVVYRTSSKGTQVKRLKALLRGGARLRVDTYGDPRVLEAVAEADVVLSGLDAREPVLVADRVAGLRDFEVRPLTVIDFNTFGSSAGLDDTPGVDVVAAHRIEEEVARCSHGLMECPAFSVAADQAETWIRDRLDRIDAGSAAATGDCPGNGHAGDPNAACQGCPWAHETRLHICPRRLMTERIAS